MAVIKTIRPLAPSEIVYATATVCIAYSVLATGELDIERLTRAFAQVRARNPILDAHLVVRDDAAVDFAAAEGAQARVIVTDGDPELVLTGAQIDQAREVSALLVVRGENAARVTLLIHHAIADGHHSLTLFEQLWSAYTDSAAFEAAHPESGDYPKSLEELLNEQPQEPAPYPLPADVPRIGTLPMEAVRCRLSAAATTALLEYARREQLTVNALLSAAILLTETKFRNVALPELHYIFAVDLRDRIEPPVAATASNNFFGYAEYHAETDETDLTAVARAVTAAFQSELAAGAILEKARTGYNPNLVAKGIVRSSNWGRIPAFVTPEGLSLSDFRGGMTVNPPAVAPPPDAPELAPGEYFIATYQGELTINFVPLPWLDEADKQGRADMLEKLLGEFA
ncbi:phthiocerol/phthiodiolone dimycocerosyl transferase family protein [Nocardia huaxiensis]|uniref:Phthiocerol/phthiodiolone dimycocerosyl transferase n=1 Tax=Nocardia huaxiensis TaxID=2755382 RepID=A0A7D6ZTF1_9NOCA|nr:hypothetical protein [Nocardia huaxiensis]QLY28209.1 hypothetical protein H0264_22765 [Nocardia huaxiensis]UFS98355.1 hypothetical protein LPY97_10870 [Nocardia huaxiensis]